MPATDKDLYTSTIDSDYLEQQLKHINFEGAVSPLHLQSCKKIIELSKDYRNDSFNDLNANKESPLSLYQFKSAGISVDSLSENPSILKHRIKALPDNSQFVDKPLSNVFELDITNRDDLEYLALLDIKELYEELDRENLAKEKEIAKKKSSLLKKIKSFYGKIGNINFPAETNDYFDEKAFMNNICGYLKPKHVIRTNKEFFEGLKKEIDHINISYTPTPEINTLIDIKTDADDLQTKFVWKISDRPKIKRKYYRKWLANRIAEKYEDKLNLLIVSKPDFISSTGVAPKKIFASFNDEPSYTKIPFNPNPYIDIPKPHLDEEFKAIENLIDKYQDFYFGPIPQDEDAYNLFLKKLKQEDEPIVVRHDIDDYL